MINYHITRARHLILNQHLHIFIIVFFQFLGTALFSYSNLNLINLKGKTQDPGKKVVYDILDFSLSMLMCISYTRQFSGGLYNPSVALFRTFRRTDRFPWKITFFYMISQFAGAITGAFIALFLNDVDSAPIKGWLPIQVQMKHLCTQIIGSFVMTFMVQLIIEKHMTFIEHNRQFYICIPMYYIVARTYSASFNCINPAFGLAFELVYCIQLCRVPQNCSWIPLAMSYIIIVGSFLGSIISVLIFEFVFRPLYPIKKQLAETMEEKRKKKDHIELEQIQRLLNMKNKWTLRQIINNQLIPAVGDEYEYHNIKNQNIDDEIQSDGDESMTEMDFSFIIENA